MCTLCMCLQRMSSRMFTFSHGKKLTEDERGRDRGRGGGGWQKSTNTQETEKQNQPNERTIEIRFFFSFFSFFVVVVVVRKNNHNRRRTMLMRMAKIWILMRPWICIAHWTGQGCVRWTEYIYRIGLNIQYIEFAGAIGGAHSLTTWYDMSVCALCVCARWFDLSRYLYNKVMHPHYMRSLCPSKSPSCHPIFRPPTFRSLECFAWNGYYHNTNAEKDAYLHKYTATHTRCGLHKRDMSQRWTRQPTSQPVERKKKKSKQKRHIHSSCRCFPFSIFSIFLFLIWFVFPFRSTDAWLENSALCIGEKINRWRG